jgi:hypothetical protein
MCDCSYDRPMVDDLREVPDGMVMLWYMSFIDL